MGRTPKYPTPRRKYHRGTWEIYWNWNGRRYSVYPGRQDENDPDIEIDVRLIAAALASISPAFPPPWDAAPAVIRYMAARYQIHPEGSADPQCSSSDSEAVLSDYHGNLRRHCAATWAATSLGLVRRLHAFVPDGILNTTVPQANKYLESFLERGYTTATRNRTMAACSRFFNWAIAHGYVNENPFKNIKALKEADLEEIVYCTKGERDRILHAAEDLGRPDWIAVAIALYAGCRREEVFNLRWEDVNLDMRRLVIRKSKTGRKRMTPIARELAEILTAVRKERGSVVPTVADESWANQADRLVELVRGRLCCPENPDKAGLPSESVGKWRFLMTEEALRGRGERLREMEERLVKMDPKKLATKKMTLAVEFLRTVPDVAADGREWIPAERLGWNAWRHTFASLRAQAGIGLDKITSWMGNSYAVCKKHYAQFMPRDAVDEDIDR